MIKSFHIFLTLPGKINFSAAWVGLIIYLWAALHDEEMATLEVDPSTSFKVAIHSSYHNDFFLLRTRVLVNGVNTEIRFVREDKYEGPVLNFRHSGSTVSTKLYLIARTASLVLVQYGVYHISCT